MLIAEVYILVLAGFVGFEVIGGVSPLLHTPLMSVTNAISAISLVGSLVIAGSADYDDPLSRVLGLLAVTAAMINVVGGFMITDRMLRMFKLKESRRVMNLNYLLEIAYLAASVAVHPRSEGPSSPEIGPARHHLCRDRHAHGRRRHARRQQHHHLGVDHHRRVVGSVDRRGHGHLHAHDRHAAANRPVALLRRLGRRAGRRGPLSQTDFAAAPSSHGTMAALGFEILFGSLTITGSLMAFGKLQEIVHGPPIIYRVPKRLEHRHLLRHARHVRLLIFFPQPAVVSTLMLLDRPGDRRADRAAHRRGRHAGGDLAVELLRRPGRLGHRVS